LNGGGHLYVPNSVLGRNHVPFLGAFSQVCKLREILHIVAMIHTSQVCNMENVSHSCNHQHSLSARESTYPEKLKFEDYIHQFNISHNNDHKESSDEDVTEVEPKFP
jgi:hypothetical protein